MAPGIAGFLFLQFCFTDFCKTETGRNLKELAKITALDNSRAFFNSIFKESDKYGYARHARINMRQYPYYQH